MKLIANISRILVGITFVFSSFVKGIDPLGTAYKMEDYFLAWGWEWALPFTLFLSVLMCTLEFILGVACLLNLRMKYMAWPLAALMLYFTVLTYFDAIFEPVPDCGCFGDAIKLNNWQTFYKNIILIFLAGFIFFCRNKFTGKASLVTQNVQLAGFIILFVVFSIHNYRHLPMIDFRGWENGADIAPDKQEQAKVHLIFKNKTTGEIQEYLSPNYPYNDSVWMSQWTFVDQQVEESGLNLGPKLDIYDFEGHDVTASIKENPDYQFILVAWGLEETSEKGFQKASKLSEATSALGWSFIVLTGSLPETVEEFRSKYDTWMEYYNADDVDLKTMIRSNPGLILIKGGIVMDKWAWRDIPDLESLKKQYPDL
jgi:uncharacterized membrane protein YphA (DoxX/SURF4 family)